MGGLGRLVRPDRADLEEQLPRNAVAAIVKKAPAALGAPLTVVVQSFDEYRPFEIEHWMARGLTVPAVGDLALVVFDEEGEAWMASWWPIDGDVLLGEAGEIASHTHPISDVTGLQAALDGKAATSHTHAQADITGLVAALTAKQATSEKGQANGYASLDSGGKVPSAQLPAIAITSITVVASQAAQLALTAQEGDVAVRSDENKTYIHNGGSAGTMADWTLLSTPTDLVLSVAGKTGAVTLVPGDIGLGNVTNDAQIPKSLADAADDILVASGADAWARKAKGSAGQVLGIDTAGALNYVDPVAAGFLLIPKLLSTRPTILLAADGTNLLTDLSNNGRNGTATGFSTVGTSPGLYGVNGSTNLDGSDDRIVTSYAMFGTGERTLLAAVYRDAHGTVADLFSSDGTNSFILRLGAASPATVSFYFDGLGTIFGTWTNAFPGNGRWVIVGFNFHDAGNHAELFIDGVSQGALSNTPSLGATPGNLVFGGSPFGTRIDGKVAYLTGWERKLTAAEHLAIAKVATGNHPGHPTYDDLMA